MKILIALTYYRPHISGLTLYNQRLAEGLVKRGHQVTVLTSRYSNKLPSSEVLNGVTIKRVPVSFRISKGVIMPSYPISAWRSIREQDCVVLNLPNTPLEALAVPIISRTLGKKVLSIFHCDVRLPGGLWNRIVEGIVWLSSFLALIFSTRVIGYTEDYATSIRLLRLFRKKMSFILPPIAIDHSSLKASSEGLTPYHQIGKPLIGFAGRIATEKGVEDLLSALLLVLERFPDCHILFAGDTENVIGERQYQRNLKPLLEKVNGHYHFLGVLNPEEMAEFYKDCVVTVLPSRNRTESFGLVQVESMLNGTPVVASDLPGVRVPIQLTGMGLLVAPGDVNGLAVALIEVLTHRKQYIRDVKDIEDMFSMKETLDSYEVLLTQI